MLQSTIYATQMKSLPNNWIEFRFLPHLSKSLIPFATKLVFKCYVLAKKHQVFLQSNQNKHSLVELFLHKENSSHQANKYQKISQLNVAIDRPQQLVQIEIPLKWKPLIKKHHSLVLRIKGKELKIWKPDSIYSFFSPRIELHHKQRDQQLRMYQQRLREILKEKKYKGIVIYPPTIDWNTTLFQRPHQLFRAFAKLGYLTFFNTPNNCFDQIKPGFKEIESNLFLANVPPDTFQLINSPILLISWAVNINWIQHMKKPQIIYDYIDELDIFHLYDQRMKRAHRHLLENSDVITVTAKTLLNKAQKLRPDAILCPNGVDVDHFSPTVQVLSHPPKDMIPIIQKQKPILGYYGALADWFDYELIRFLAQSHKYQIILIGPDFDGSFKKSGLTKHSNVAYLGPKPYKILPRYLRQFDVSLIPFKINNITLSTNPIKMYEYMAGGKPIVSTNLPECQLEADVYTASTPHDFMAKIDLALQKERLGTLSKRLQKRALDHTWIARAKQMLVPLLRK